MKKMLIIVAVTLAGLLAVPATKASAAVMESPVTMVQTHGLCSNETEKKDDDNKKDDDGKKKGDKKKDKDKKEIKINIFIFIIL